MKKRKEIPIILMFITIFAWIIYYSKLPAYTISSSTNISSDDFKETSLNVQVYKIFGGKELYAEIANNHNHLNGKPDKLELNLYLFNYCYRTIIFDYENHVEYIYLDYLPQDR